MIEKINLKLPQWALENVILLNVRLNDRTLVRMMLDTGAEYTVITPNIHEAQRALNCAGVHNVDIRQLGHRLLEVV